MSPAYSSSLVPTVVGDKSRCNLRNADNVKMVQFQNTHKKSFIPSAIDEWNHLPLDALNTNSLEVFKTYLNADLVTSKQSSYFYFGKRLRQIYHTRLRTMSSGLDNHLFIKKT